jgi:hypothetical protein
VLNWLIESLCKVLRALKFKTVREAKNQAKKWSFEINSSCKLVISFYRSTDSQNGFVNPDGVGLTGTDWFEYFADRYKHLEG